MNEMTTIEVSVGKTNWKENKHLKLYSTEFYFVAIDFNKI